MKSADEYAGAAGRLPSDGPTEKPSSAELGSDGADLAQFRPAPSAEGVAVMTLKPGDVLSIEQLLGLQNYNAVPVRVVDELPPETPVGEAWRAYRALEDAEHQRNLNRRASAAVELVNRRRIEADYEERLREQQRHVAEAMVLEMHEGVADVGLQYGAHRLTNCSPGRSAYLTRTSIARNILVGAAMGAVMGASVAIFAVGVYTVLRAIFG